MADCLDTIAPDEEYPPPRENQKSSESVRDAVDTAPDLNEVNHEKIPIAPIN
jgi:hypothetical protein